MQLANQSGESDQKMSPSIYAALIDSLFTDPGPMFAGALCAAVAAVMTALKTGNALLWPCVALLVVTGALRALDTRQYQKVRSTSLTAEDAARWEMRYQFGAMLYAAALGLWCLVALTGSDDAVAHMICDLGHAVLRGGRRRPHLRPAVDLPCADAAGLRPADGGAGARWQPLSTSAWRC